MAGRPGGRGTPGFAGFDVGGRPDPVRYGVRPGEQGGIHAYAFDTHVGRLKPLRRTAVAESPFFLALAPNNRFLYSTHAEQIGGTEMEHVAA